METRTKIVMGLYLLISLSGVRAWTGEIHGRVVCDVCGDSLIGTEDHALEGYGLLLIMVGDKNHGVF
ncbi:hypothetical protein HHK36_033172 [Tetracentron sinense]|uniref:Uncharacterized protein n=1 Tax=Tetracentron sinense TaxID=13715 RepID=A0A835CZS0_TETSI|nr:hypothetical protein HHK36_033172 [Tetracentron sinense]